MLMHFRSDAYDLEVALPKFIREVALPRYTCTPRENICTKNNYYSPLHTSLLYNIVEHEEITFNEI